MTAEPWVDALQQRHRSNFTTSEFLKAVRALSARYVEQRSSIRDRAPLDSAGKRSAFAAFYAPLHFFTTREIIRNLPRRESPPELIVDLGCGPGVVSAAWALESRADLKVRPSGHMTSGAPDLLGPEARTDPKVRPSGHVTSGALDLLGPGAPKVLGIDAHPWALSEAGWNWRQLGLRGGVERADFARAAEQLLKRSKPQARGMAIVAGWSVNELSNDARAGLLPTLIEFGRRGASVLIVEPIAKSAVPWWHEWESAFVGAGGRANEWRFAAALPSTLRALSDAAGFRRDELTARTLALG